MASQRHALLVELPSGAIVAVLFPTSEEARAWDQEHEHDVLTVGNVPVFTKSQVLSQIGGKA